MHDTELARVASRLDSLDAQRWRNERRRTHDKEQQTAAKDTCRGLSKCHTQWYGSIVESKQVMREKRTDHNKMRETNKDNDGCT